MPEDSPTYDPLPRRSAFSLPPRKRLLAGFKHSHWSLPLSRSDGIAVLQVNKCHLDESSKCELEENHLEGKKSENEQVEESIFSYNRRHRKSRRESVSSITRFKDKRNAGNDGCISCAANDLEIEHHSEEEALKIDDVVKYYCSTDEAENLESSNRVENPFSYFDMTKPRRNPNRQNHMKAKDLFDQINKTSHSTQSRSDEDLARELHRAMNSSPRILGHRNLKLGSTLSSSH